MLAELAAKLVAAPHDLDVLAALVAIALVAAVVAELAAELVAAPSTSTCSPRWSPSRWWPR